MNRDTRMLHERQCAAVKYFTTHVISPFVQWKDAHFTELDKHPKVGKQNKLWAEIKTTLVVKRRQLQDVVLVAATAVEQKGE